MLMYGLFPYIWVVYGDKCIETHPTWSVWDMNLGVYKDRDLSPLIDLVNPPKDMVVIGIGVISSQNAKRNLPGLQGGPRLPIIISLRVMGLPLSAWPEINGRPGGFHVTPFSVEWHGPLHTSGRGPPCGNCSKLLRVILGIVIQKASKSYEIIRIL